MKQDFFIKCNNTLCQMWLVRRLIGTSITIDGCAAKLSTSGLAFCHSMTRFDRTFRQ